MQDRDRQIIDLRLNGLETISQIGRRFGITAQRVQQILDRAGMTGRAPEAPATLPRIVLSGRDFWKRRVHLTNKQIAEEAGFNAVTVARYRRECGVPLYFEYLWRHGRARCCMCRRVKLRSEFHDGGGGTINRRCKLCANAYAKEIYRRRTAHRHRS